ncbi:MAG: VanZ family protein [Oscillospiraceae bacterium]|jgi:glycopeptide antibiotics resistance protein|nr:VanZ family protein [Oscillospiraceae bacterium]
MTPIYITQAVLLELILLPTIAIVRFYRRKKRSTKTSVPREVGILLFSAYIIGVLSLTVIPELEFSEHGIGIYRPMVNGSRTGGINLIPVVGIVEGLSNGRYVLIIGNALLLTPLPFFLNLLYRVSTAKMLIIGVLASVSIEIIQLPLSRGTDIDDVLLNSLGVLVGLALLHVVKRFKKSGGE